MAITEGSSSGLQVDCVFVMFTSFSLVHGRRLIEGEVGGGDIPTVVAVWPVGGVKAAQQHRWPNGVRPPGGRWLEAGPRRS